MSDSKQRLEAIPGYVDQTARKERFLAEHPDANIDFDEAASVYERWRGAVPGHERVSSAELGQLLDRLEEVIAVDEAEGRWPGWKFTRIGNQWKAQEAAGSRVVWGPTLRTVEARVGLEERAGSLRGSVLQYGRLCTAVTGLSGVSPHLEKERYG